MKDPDVTSVEQLDALLAEGTISEKDYEALRSAMEQKESEETRTDAAPMRPKLRRSMKNRQLGGVCAGIGEHLGVDPNLVRLIAVLLLLLSGGAVILVYIVFLFALPVAKEKRETGARTEGARGGFPWLFTATVLFLWMVHLAYSVYILPRFARYWDEAGAELPGLTQILVTLYDSVLGRSFLGLLFQVGFLTLLIVAYGFLPKRSSARAAMWIVLGLAFAIWGIAALTALQFPLFQMGDVR